MPGSAPKIPPKLAEEAVALAMRLHRHRPWTATVPEDAYAIRIPGVEQPYFLSLLGHAGDQFGIACYAGLDGLTDLRQLVLHGRDDDYIFHSEVLVVTVDPQRRIPLYLRDIYRAAHHEEPLAPSFMRVHPSTAARSMRKPELRRTCEILRGYLLAHERGLLRPSPLPLSGTNRLLTIDVEDGDIRARFENHGPTSDDTASDITAPPDLPGPPRLDATWTACFRSLSNEVDRDEPSPFLLMVVDNADDEILELQVVKNAEVERASSLLLELVRSGASETRPGLPQRVDFTSRSLYEAVAAALAELGVETSFEPDRPELDSLFEQVAEVYHEQIANLPELDPAERSRTALHVRVDAEIDRRGLLTPRRYEEFFGMTPPDLDSHLAADAITEWLLVDHRPSTRHRSLAQKLLGSDLPDDERALLEARVRAAPSIYRLDRVDGDFVTISELFGDRVIRLRHPEGDTALPLGTLLAGRVCEVPDDTFIALLAPPIPAILADRAITFLEQDGMELSAAGVARSPHLLGRLFGWLDEAAATPPKLQNTAGEPLRLQNASFHCDDPDAVAREIDSRGDVDPGESDGSWIWFRQEDTPQRTQLARLQLIGDHLVVEVNSDGRLDRVRSWLERIEGLRFESSTELESDPSRAIPHPEAETTPEMIAAVQEVIREHYRAWVDDALPALSGLTPREAVETADGRQRVELLLRTMTDPAGIPGVAVPLDEIRRELGLDPE